VASCVPKLVILHEFVVGDLQVEFGPHDQDDQALQVLELGYSCIADMSCLVFRSACPGATEVMI
jgi:hypothetical protein